MIELYGKNGNAKVFTNNIDNETISQVINLLNQECVKDSKIRIMPDAHAGKGCVIGTTMTLVDKVIPNLVGVDIGCGITVIKLKEKRIDFPKLDDVIRKYVPSGLNIHESAIADSNIYFMECAGNVDIERAYRSLGTLGGGNHFIEVDKDKDGFLYLVIHTGSRHLGIEVCNYYQNLGYEALKETNLGGNIAELTKELISKLKSEGRDKEISNAIKSLKEGFDKNAINISQALAYVEGANFNSYLHDMKLTQEHASINRKVIATSIMKNMNLHELERFETIHNYIDIDNMILRKGSISAQLGEKIIIPMNMRDGSLICIGKGNPDWNYSAPHGAGRVMSRSEAKNKVSLDEYKDTMAGIFSTSVNINTIDESPMAYKPMQEIIDNIESSVDIMDIIKPVYNFKAN